MSNFDALVAKLREIFQIDRPDLDFGVYRILNARAGEIEDYLSKRLKARVAEALAAGAAANTETLKAAISKARESAEAAGYNPEEAPKVLSLQKELAAASSGASEHENQVFSHLLTFFSRYYDKGDFISQRRYKGDTYAIPYSGEEVVLHWANRDQYYTKSGESFSNFSFKLDDGRAVHFRLVAADTAKDNRKDNDKERRFVLATARTIARTDDDGETVEETIQPVTEENGALVIRFDYAPQPKGTKQEALVDQAVAVVLDDEAVKARWLALTNRAPTEKNPKRTVLEKHLTTYTQKNTADYFIHKDLGGFLRRELDFYIKNEVMNLDDVQGAEAFAAIEKNLRMIQTLRAIALDLITFLASIENFQKKLWLKKKFVVAAQYCVTLDRVPQTLYPAVAANPAQWAQWHDLGMRASAAAGTVEDLKSAPFLMVDTALFDAGFRADLLKAIPDLDASLDGLLVHGDNFQALGLLGERYREQVKCVYIDPPYNTGKDGFVYKDGFASSSWSALIADRFAAEKAMLANENARFVSLDENQMSEAIQIIKQENRTLHGILTWRRTRTGGHLSNSFNQLSDYVLVSTGSYQQRLFGGQADAEESQPLTKSTNKEKTLIIPAGRLEFLDTEDAIIEAGYAGGVKAVARIEVVDGLNKHDAELVGNFIWVQEKLNDELVSGARIVIKRLKNFNPRFFRDPEGFKPFPSLADGSFSVGTNEDASSLLIEALGFDASAISYPKPVDLCERLVWAKAFFDRSCLVMDYFSGSGTTAHAVLNLNRKHDAQLRYLCAEQGQVFIDVLKPRLQKVVYSADWFEGKPTAPETGISHAFKVLKIEGYEDALNNLDLKRPDGVTDLFNKIGDTARDDYLMRYMLDVEAKGSLLSVSDFRKPFDYTLKVAIDSAGAWEERKVDLVETFNYLIGLTVRTIDIQLKQGFVTVTGHLPTGEKTLILWRDCEKIGYEELTRLCDKLAINPADSEFDVVYINGDHNIPSVVETTEEEGSVIKKLMLRQIEPAFLDAMFNVDDV